ncbi:MAG: tetratricopeptide repeat protein [Armatimonadetes bacterium]|nr:tetratricopeptide repeat protein [Anaerolineae bacterium]
MITPTLTPLYTEYRPVQALYRLEADAARDGWRYATRRRAGDIAYDIGRVDDALAHWQAANILQPNQLGLLTRLAETYLALGQWTPLADTLRALLAVSPGNAWAQFQLGLVLAPISPAEARTHLRAAALTLDYRPQAGALILLLEAADANTDESELAMRVGFIGVEQSRWAHAEHAFRHAADLAPDNSTALAYVGLARARQGKTADAWLTSALELNPGDATAHYVAGLVYAGRGDYEAGVQAFTLALALDPLEPAYYAEVASIYETLGDLPDAEIWLREAVRVAGDIPRYQQLLADFYVKYPALTP